MSHHCWLLALLAGLLAAAAWGEDDLSRPEQVLKYFNDGTANLEKGEYAKSVAAYLGARKAAHEKGLAPLEGEAALHLGEVLQDWAFREKDPKKRADRLHEAEQSYQDAIHLGDPKVKLLAQNNLGVLYVRQGKEKTAEAREVFKSMDLTSGDLKPSQKAVYLANRASALEKNDKPQEAYHFYQQALQEQPRYQPAVEGAFRVLLKQPTDKDVNDALQLAANLSAGGQGEAAAQQVRACLEQWPNRYAQRLLAVVVRQYAASGLSPDDFQRREADHLQTVRGKQPQLNKAIEEIQRAYTGDFAPGFYDSGVRELFPSWSQEDWQRQAFAPLLKTTGDYYYRTASADRNPRKALARYAAAWTLDRANTETAVYVAAVLRDAPKLDPQRELYLQFLETVMEVKGEHYKIPQKNKEDWDTILRLHFLLGTLFEQDRQWGSKDNPRSALFQWDRALKAEAELRRLDATVRPAPALHAHVALAYRATNHPADAWDHYLTATEGFVLLNDRASADDALTGAAALKRDLSPPEKERLTRVEDKLAALKKASQK